jgi:hypothetical protein
LTRRKPASPIVVAESWPVEEIAGIAPASRPAERSRQIFGVSDASLRIGGVSAAAIGERSNAAALAVWTSFLRVMSDVIGKLTSFT